MIKSGPYWVNDLICCNSSLGIFRPRANFSEWKCSHLFGTKDGGRAGDAEDAGGDGDGAAQAGMAPAIACGRGGVNITDYSYRFTRITLI